MGFDIKGKEPTPQEQAEKTRVNENVSPAFGSGDAFKYDVNYHRMSDFLGLNEVDRIDADLASKVSFLRDYTGEKDEGSAMLKIKGMIREMGLSVKGKELLIDLYKYARLAQERSDIDKQMQAYSGEEPKSVKPRANPHTTALKNKLQKAVEEKKKLVKKVRELSRLKLQTYVNQSYW